MGERVGVLGATSLVGEYLLPLLVKSSFDVVAFSRRDKADGGSGVEWRRLDAEKMPGIAPLRQCTSVLTADPSSGERKEDRWIFLAPIWVLPAYFNLLAAHGVKRVVALSSTSRFTKASSSDPAEQAVANRLIEGEQRLIAWAGAHGVEWIILRPTLIYGSGRDQNISNIARFIRRFGFFPVWGQACGLRQPVHAADVATACLEAITTAGVANRAYNLSGGETLPYRDMVCRVFAALGKRPCLLEVPLGVFRLAVACLRLVPRFRHWSAAMAERMNQDLVFEHALAARDLNFSPRPFRLQVEDLPE